MGLLGSYADFTCTIWLFLKLKFLFSHRVCFCFASSTVKLRFFSVNFSSSFYRLIFGYDFPSNYRPHTHYYFPYLPTLLDIFVSVSRVETLPVRGFLLHHHNHATKVTSLLLFLFLFYFKQLIPDIIQKFFAEVHVKRSVILTDRLGPDILLVLTMKRQVLHRERAHLKVPGCSLVLSALLTKKLPTFLSRLNEISGGCEKILPVSGSFWSNLKLLRMMLLTA